MEASDRQTLGQIRLPEKRGLQNRSDDLGGRAFGLTCLDGALGYADLGARKCAPMSLADPGRAPHRELGCQQQTGQLCPSSN